MPILSSEGEGHIGSTAIARRNPNPA